MFPVYIYEKDKKLPETGTYFVVAGNGLWIHKDMPVYQGFVKVNNISCLDDLNTEDYLKCKLPRIPFVLVWKIKQFFKEVIKKHHAESCTVLFYNFEKNHWIVHIPVQTVSHGGVQYLREGASSLSNMDGYLPVGTIHSHCDFQAFHSNTDQDDENTFDGFHGTFGHNDKDVFSITTSFVINGTRFKLNPLDFLEGINQNAHGKEFYYLDEYNEDWAEELNSWMSKVSSRSYFYSSFRQENKYFPVGSKVSWAAESNFTALRGFLGDGPFEVIGKEPGKLIIRTSIGSYNLPEKFFQREVFKGNSNYE